MKRCFVLLLVVFSLFSWSACAESFDFSAMSDAELQTLIDLAKNELSSRNASSDGKIFLFDVDGVSAYLTGKYEIWGSDTYYLTLEAVISNQSDVAVSVSADESSINGWNVFAMGMSELDPGKKEKIGIDLELSDAEISTYEEIEELELSFYFFDPETYMTTKELDPIIVPLNK